LSDRRTAGLSYPIFTTDGPHTLAERASMFRRIQVRTCASHVTTETDQHIKFGAKRGATMVSVMLLTLSMLTVATLVVRSSSRQAVQAGANVAREKAMMAAQSAVDLAAAHYRRQVVEQPPSDNSVLSNALMGYNPPTDPSSCTTGWDCVPGMGSQVPMTGQRNHMIGRQLSDCSGRPCMRPGSIVRLPAAGGALTDWSNVPMSEVLLNGDPEAIISVWIRNNTSEALGSGNQSGSWVADRDKRVVITAMATVRNTTVAIEQEYFIKPVGGATPLVPPTPDDGYGGGHHGDNTAVVVCEENYAGANLGN